MNPERKVTSSAGGVVLNRKGQVLVVSQRGRSWSLPKGHIETGEDALEAARREIYEETGLQELKYRKALGAYERARIGQDGGENGSEWKKLTFFLFETEEEALKPVDSDIPEARWVDRDKVAELLTHPKDREFFIQILQEI